MKYQYPIITEDNFERVTKNMIGYKKIRSNRFGGMWERYPYLKVKAPSTRNEFYEFTKAIFGEGMELIGYYGHPGIKHSKDAYDNPIFKLWRDKFHDGWRLIGYTAFGNMGTGGWDYGSFDFGFKYREKKRLEKLFDSKLSIRYDKSSNQT